MNELSIIIPCYNEEACIEEVVASWTKEIRKKIASFELIVINDGSKDRSGEILDRLKAKVPELIVVHQKNQGHGPAVLNGYRTAQAEWVFHTDSDAQFTPEDFWKLWDARSESPYLIGFRATRHDPTHRLVLTVIVRFLARLLTGIPLRDTNIPYKLIRRDLLMKLLPGLPNDTLTPSILLAVGAHREGVKFVEIPVQHFARTTGTTVLKPIRLAKFCIRAFGQLLRYLRSESAGSAR